MRAPRLGWTAVAVGLAASALGVMVVLRHRQVATPQQPPRPLHDAPQAPGVEPPAEVARPAGKRPPNANAPAPPDKRPQVQAAVDRTLAALPSQAIDERTLRSLFDRLETEARAQKAVTAFQVEPGLAAIDAARGQIGPAEAQELRDEFTDRMARLSAELTGPQEPSEQPEDLLVALRNASGDDRQALIRRYVQAAGHLPPAQRQAAMDRLQTLLGKAPD